MTARRRHSTVIATLAALVAALCAAAPAAATTLFSGDLSAAQAERRLCEDGLVPGARGVAVTELMAADTGLVRARLGAPSGDWDVALYDAKSGRLVTASTGFGSRELAEGAAVAGQRLVVQACRRSGDAETASVGVSTIPLGDAAGDKVQLVRIAADTHAERTTVASSGLDLTEHAGPGHVDVLAHGAEDIARIRELGLPFEILFTDVAAADRKALELGADDTTPAMPSGRTDYRRLWEYTSDMKALAERHPDFVKPLTLPHPSLEGRAVDGIEIARDVHAADGRPVFLQMGIHHAREWPSGEHAIEFAHDLLNHRDGSIALADRTVNVADLLTRVRTIVVPVVNPDGFNWSREAAIDGQQGVIPASFAYKRKNCRVTDGLLPQPGECGADENMRLGVDPNRNYGGFWGGAGASGDPANDTYWGAGPFSEPETQNVRELVSGRQVVTLITNHTYSDLVLRPPGLKSQGEPYDEHAHYKPLGDAMAGQNGYASQYSYELYDTTGTTEDWSYYATGGLGFTFEIGKGEGVALTGAGFHPAWPVGVPAEYFGKGPWFGKGNRGAYLLALENAADTGSHSRIAGSAQPGSRLRLTKSFATYTSPREENGGRPIAITDTLSDTLVVGPDGRFDWHVNPSTRPNVAKGVPGRELSGLPTSEPRDFATSGTPFAPGAGQPVPGTYEEVPFEIPASEDNGRTTLRIEWPARATDVVSDLDLKVFRRTEDGEWAQIGSSTSDNSSTQPCTLAGRTGDCYYEQAEVPDLGNGQFMFRVENWASTNTDWRGRMTFEAPVASEGAAPGTESWTLTCEDAKGRVKAERQVTVARGERVSVGDACRKPRR